MQLSVTVNAIIAFPNAEIHTANQYRSELTISHCDLFECPLDVSYRAVFTFSLLGALEQPSCVTMDLQGLCCIPILSSVLILYTIRPSLVYSLFPVTACINF